MEHSLDLICTLEDLFDLMDYTTKIKPSYVHIFFTEFFFLRHFSSSIEILLSLLVPEEHGTIIPAKHQQRNAACWRLTVIVALIS